jgi:hypothetical protein
VALARCAQSLDACAVKPVDRQKARELIRNIPHALGLLGGIVTAIASPEYKP